ncbi:MAG TPA: SAM-dependent methyltransferase, partial [Bryobacterales bacterium]|nr:SAM-dependent methyltransferase [Bryobacterales bacterium]
MAIETRTGPINIAAAERKECPVCGKPGSETIYRQESVPVHSVLLFRSREEALNFPRGSLTLVRCDACGFVWNADFDESAMRYSAEYEETQGFSETFNGFQRKLAERLVERHGLRQKKLIEIGCGKGEFLTLLCELGRNTGVGFDPAYVRERSRSRESRRVRFIR